MDRKLGPLTLEYIDQTKPGECKACGEQFKEGDFVTLAPLGPGSDPEERAKAREGRYYNAVCILLHWACHTGEENDPTGTV